MSLLDSRIPVGQLVAERLDRARVFDRFGIDYCCGGKKPLDQACREKGLNVDEVLHTLESFDAEAAPVGRNDWNTATLSDLIDHIVSHHHDYLRDELPRLAAHAEKVARVHGERHPELRELRAVFLALKDELELHMIKEEKVLFPMIKRLESASELPIINRGSIDNPIRVMEHEHDDAGSALARLRKLTDDYEPPADACTTYRALLAGLAELEADLHRHVHKENTILFPLALAAESRLLAGASRLQDE